MLLKRALGAIHRSGQRLREIGREAAAGIGRAGRHLEREIWFQGEIDVVERDLFRIARQCPSACGARLRFDKPSFAQRAHNPPDMNRVNAHHRGNGARGHRLAFAHLLRNKGERHGMHTDHEPTVPLQIPLPTKIRNHLSYELPNVKTVEGKLLAPAT